RFDLVYQLEIDGFAGFVIDLKNHACLLSYDSRTVGRSCQGLSFGKSAHASCPPYGQKKATRVGHQPYGVFTNGQATSRFWVQSSLWDSVRSTCFPALKRWANLISSR